MLRTNEDKLVKISVTGEINHPTLPKAGYNVCSDGSLTVVPGVGGIVAIMDADHSYGRIFKSGAVSIGVVVHSDSRVSGHGPGVATLMTSPGGKIVPRIDKRANIMTMLKLKRAADK